MERSHGKRSLAAWSAAMVLLLLLAAPGIAGDEGAASASSDPGGFDLAELAKLDQLSGSGGAEETEFPLQAGYDSSEGFFISDKDKEHFLLKVGGRLQIRYTYKGRDKRGDTVDPGEVGDGDESYFELERARFNFSGHLLNPNLTYYIQFDGDSDGAGGVRTLDAYMLYHAGEALGGGKDVFSIGVGQWKPYFLRQEATSSGSLQMVERSLTNEFFNTDRQLGAWVQGVVKPFFYSFAVTNGFDSINVSGDDVDHVPTFLGKLDFWVLGEPTGKYEESNVKEKEEWVIGLSGGTDWNNGTGDPGAAQYSCYTFGIDTAFKYSLFSLQAEYVGRWLDYDLETSAAAAGDGGSTYAHGLYVQGGMFLVPNELELTGRVSTVWADGSQDGSGIEVGPGLSWYISKNHKVKLQTDLMFFDISGNLPNQSESLDVNDLYAGDFDSGAANLEAGEQGVMWRTQLQLQF